MEEKISLRLIIGVRIQQPGRRPDYAKLAQAALHAPDGRRPLPDAAVRRKDVPRHLPSSGAVTVGGVPLLLLLFSRRTIPPSSNQSTILGAPKVLL